MKHLLTLMVACVFAVAAFAQTKSTLVSNAECKFTNAKTWDWVTGFYKSDPIALDNTKDAIVEVTFKEVTPAQKFAVIVQSSQGKNDQVNMAAQAKAGTVVRIRLSNATNIQQVALQNMDVEGKADGSVSAKIDVALISDIDYAASTSLETTLVNEGKNTAVSAATLQALGDYDVITVKYSLTGSPDKGHENYGVGAVCNNVTDWPKLFELNANATSVSFFIADIKEAINSGIVFNLWKVDSATANLTSVTIEKCKSNISTPIATVNSDAEVVSCEYYDINGVKIGEMAKGINIVVEKLSDGTVRTSKVVKK